jgi:hypothetical protein
VFRRPIVAIGGTVLVAGIIGACGSSPTSSTPPTTATVTSISVAGTAPTLGATTQFTATATLSNNTTQSVTSQATWQSSNTAIATVSTGGLVTGVSAGTADITATYQSVTGRVSMTIGRPTGQTYTISGTVTDGTSSGVLPNIDIQVTDSTGKMLSTRTGSTGTYTISGVASGTVSLTAAAISYESTTLSLALTADQRVDIVMKRVTCTFSVTPTMFSFSSAGGQGMVKVVSQAVGCTWTATASSTGSFLTITSGSTGLDNGTVAFSVAPNPGPTLPGSVGVPRSGTLAIAGTTIAVSQDGPRISVAAYDPTFKAPVCQDVGEGCIGASASAGPGEANQPNTIFSACPDGSGLASIDLISVTTPDGTPLTGGKPVAIIVNARPGQPGPHLYLAADAQRPSWSEVPVLRFSNTFFTASTVLPAGAGLQAIRAIYSGDGIAPGPGPCAIGTNFDTDDVVFRVQ